MQAELEAFKSVSYDDVKKGMDADGHFDVLRFFANKDIKTRLPHHYLLARQTFSSLATEANCERTFSFSGQLLSALRNSLDPNIVRMLMFVGVNWTAMARLRPTSKEVKEEYVRKYDSVHEAEHDHDDSDLDEEEQSCQQCGPFNTCTC